MISPCRNTYEIMSAINHSAIMGDTDAQLLGFGMGKFSLKVRLPIRDRRLATIFYRILFVLFEFFSNQAKTFYIHLHNYVIIFIVLLHVVCRVSVDA